MVGVLGLVVGLSTGEPIDLGPGLSGLRTGVRGGGGEDNPDSGLPRSKLSTLDGLGILNVCESALLCCRNFSNGILLVYFLFLRPGAFSGGGVRKTLVHLAALVFLLYFLSVFSFDSVVAMILLCMSALNSVNIQ